MDIKLKEEPRIVIDISIDEAKRIKEFLGKFNHKELQDKKLSEETIQVSYDMYDMINIFLDEYIF